MVVKILKSSSTFAAVNYSEAKNSKKLSELLCASGFEEMGIVSESLTKCDYRAYMKLVASRNARVTKRQFHATISARGKEHSHHELQKVGEEFLTRMGYGNNPYLIYAHYDTDNNHIHLVSTRVSKEGKKIDDRFEKIKAQKILGEILNRNPKEELDRAIQHALSYNFSTQSQFILLMKLKGFRVSIDQDRIRLSKYGRNIYTINKSLIDKNISCFEDDEERRKQIYTLLSKHSKGIKTEKLTRLMHDRFDVELVFHSAKGQLQPYDYTVIDHERKNVYNGNAIMNLNVLLDIQSLEDKVQAGKEVIRKGITQGESLMQVNELLKDFGMHVNERNGQVILEGNTTGSVSMKGLDQLWYNDRLKSASSYRFYTHQEKQVLAYIFDVNTSQLKATDKKQHTEQWLNEFTRIAAVQHNTTQFLKDEGFRVLNFQGKNFLIDDQQKEVVTLTNHQTRNLDLSPEQSINVERLKEWKRPVDKMHGYTVAGTILDIFSLMDNETEQLNRKKKKRTLKRQN